MTLPVPLAIRVGDQHVTAQAQSLSFRREAVGGVRSISFTLARPLDDLAGLDPLAQVTVYDARTAGPVAQGRLTDTGRGATSDGPRWDCVAFGPAQHASDLTIPVVYVDRDRSRFEPTYLSSAMIQIGEGSRPNSNPPEQGILITFPDGTPVNTNSAGAMGYLTLIQTGQKLARYDYTWNVGITSANWRVRAVTTSSGGGFEVSRDDAFNTAGGGPSNRDVVTDFPNGRDGIHFQVEYIGGASTVGGDGNWAHYANPTITAMRYDKSGVELTAGYNYVVVAHEVVEDLLGRMLTEYDGANATIDTAAAHQIDQLAYVDGVTAEQVLADLMSIEPAHRWYTTPDTTGDGYGFRWETWPTTVRYEATLDDGGSFPLSAQGIYNRVHVRWVDMNGAPRWTVRTMVSEILDDEGLTRGAMLDLGSEVNSEDNAIATGDSFLAGHNVPKNAGTLTVARPIRDVIDGRMVQPWEIEAGELVRIRGVEAYPDAFNADTNDGQGVFRIHAVDYTTDGNVATLALDSDPRETEDALVKLLNQRSRR